MSAELGVGRTPVREALLRLKSEHLVGSHPNKTAFVKEITLKDIRDIFESLAAIEKLTACMAAQRITSGALDEIEEAEKETAEAVDKKDFWQIESYNQKFHKLIAKACDNQYLTSIHEDLRNKAERLSYLTISRDLETNMTLDEHLRSLRKNHREIVRCLRRRDIKRLEKLSVEHIRLGQNRIMAYFSNYIT